MTEILKQGVPAPDITLAKGNGQMEDKVENYFTLSTKKGKNIILTFYPADWSPVCSSQLALYNELLPVFSEYNAEIYGISVDGNYCHAAFRKYNNINIELLCDFEPKGRVARLYGCYDEKNGICKRAIFVLDKNGDIRYSYLSPIDVNPGAKEILETLKTLQS